MRILFTLLVISIAPLLAADAQIRRNEPVANLLRDLFPDAAAFSEKQGDPPHYRALAESASGAADEVIGYAYWTTELDPLERGYDGPIKMLVGMGLNGRLRGIILTEHYEPYGDFSIERRAFSEQFIDKDIRDRFRYDDDIDAVSRATITVRSASRAVRNSSRRIAREYLTPPSQQ